jgi:hypothetical protein
MPILQRRSITVAQALALIITALVVTTPASAQFGGLKKKLKGDATAKAADKAGEAAGADAAKAPEPTAAAAHGAPAATEQTLVLTPDVVDRLVAGLKAGAAEREAAKKEDTPYGRYQKAKAAYEVAKPKCEAAMQPGIQRIAADEKKNARYQRLAEKMMEAANRKDYVAQQAYSDSSMAMIDASCTVKQPEEPKDYNDERRAIDNRAEQATLKASGFTGKEFGQVSDRTIAILAQNPPPTDVSASEKAAVKAKDPELKSLLGIRDAQEERIAKQAPAPAPAVVADTVKPTAAPSPAVSVNECMVKNVQAHEAEIQALGDRGSAAQQAGNTALMMAIADSIQQIQFAGCKRL